MTRREFTLPVIAAACWFEEDPGLAPGPFLDVAWGQPDLGFLEPSQRRRLSRLARGAFHCAGRLPAAGDFRLVFASRHGESERTLAILRDLAAGVDVSPAQFSMSVHNAVPGLVSILRGSRGPAAAVAAGPESLGCGLLEALGSLGTDPSPVLLLHGEDRLPALWEPSAGPEAPHALGLLLGEGGRPLVLGWDPAGRGAAPGSSQALHLLAALAGGGEREPWRGPTAAWDWHLA